MVKCVFCGKEESIHKGIHLMKNDGSISYFCSSKCSKNSLKLGRDKRKLKWTESFHVSRAKIAERKASEENRQNAEAHKKSGEKKEKLNK